MAQRQFTLDERTTITIYKRKKSRNLRLSITSNGIIRVSIPTWAPYSAGVQFAKSRQRWIESQRPKSEQFLQHGQQIGKAHRLHFVPTNATKVTSRVRASEVLVSHPQHLPINNPVVQKTANQAAI